MDAWVPRFARRGVLLGMSVGIPALSFLRSGPPATDPALSGAGWRELALPAGMVIRTDPLAGWEALDAMVAAIQEPVPDPPPDGLAAPEQQPATGPATRGCRFKIYGLVDEGDRVLYLFLDTEKGRWFRLEPGATDMVSMAALSNPAAGGGLVLHDLVRDCGYRIRRNQLEPLCAK